MKIIFDEICLWIGRGLVGATAIILLGYIFAIILKYTFVLFKRLWYCIKGLLPPFWITEEKWENYRKTVESYKNSGVPCLSNNWRRRVKFFRKGQFGNIYSSEKQNWWDTKNHFKYIKKNK